MSNEPNKPIPAQELTEKELEGIAGGVRELKAIEALHKAAEADCKRMEDKGFERPEQRYSFMFD